MRLTLRFVAFVIVSAAISHAQTPSPAATYVLHAKSPPHANNLSLTLVAAAPESVLGVTSDGRTVLALVPQENREWSLKMLTGWETGAPREQTLTFEGDGSRNKQDYVTGSLTPTPDDKYLLVRIFVFHLDKLTREAVVLLIDMPSFHVVWRRISADPLIANSRWHFSDQDTLIAAEGPPASEGGKRYAVLPDVLTMNPSTIGEHVAARLSFPDLNSSLPCRYMVSSGPFDTGPSSKSVLLESDPCSNLLKVAGLTTGMDLPGPADVRRVEKLAGPDCELAALVAERKLALYNCRSGRDLGKYGFVTKARAVKVLLASDGSADLSMPLPIKQTISSTLATANGHDYLLLLRDGIKLEAYMLH